jgi:Flp pilus assembly protein TadG
MMTNLSSPQTHSPMRRRKGQAAVEFALSIPILLMVVFGILDFSMLFATWLSLENVARQAVRYASTGQYDKTACPAPCTSNADVDTARLITIHKVANQSIGPLIHPISSATKLDPGFFQVLVIPGSPSQPK